MEGFLDRGKALSSTAVRLAPETGLIGSPTVDKDGILEATMQMIPDIRCGGLVTSDARRVKGAYRIEEAEWVGDSSGADWGITVRGSRY